jgi:hypothetical protein
MDAHVYVYTYIHTHTHTHIQAWDDASAARVATPWMLCWTGEGEQFWLNTVFIYAYECVYVHGILLDDIHVHTHAHIQKIHTHTHTLAFKKTEVAHENGNMHINRV